MKSLIQLLLSTYSGFALGCGLMRNDPELMLISGFIGALVLFTTYLILFVIHAIFKRLCKQTDCDNEAEPNSLMGFDSHGKLKIESHLLSR
jgi:hypothetical protein